MATDAFIRGFVVGGFFGFTLVAVVLGYTLRPGAFAELACRFVS